MLTICEDCGKKYNINESRIRGNRARFTCKECGHIIIVNKSDTTRPLISSSSALNASFDESSTIDLLKEMEAPAIVQPAVREDISQNSDKNQTRNFNNEANGRSIITYILMGLFITFICISGALGYLYAVNFANILKQQAGNAQTGVLENTLMAFGIAWVIALAVFFVIARSITKPLKIVKEGINCINQGEPVSIVPKGPKEVQELANAVSKVSDKLH